VEGFSRVVDFSFHLWTHVQNVPKINTIEDHIHAWEAQINDKKKSLASLQLVVPKEAMMKMFSLHRHIAST